MDQTNSTRSKPIGSTIQTVVTNGISTTLTPEQIQQVFSEMFEKMKTPDPDNPNLWTVHISGHRIWGILDEGAGEDGRSLLTLLFPSEY